MATPRRTQKQIAEKYRGNLGYYNKIHFGRLARFTLIFLTLSLGVAAIVLYQRHGNERFFNPGKLSSNHAALVDQCASCHDKSLLTGGQLTRSKLQETLSDRFYHGIDFDPIDKNCAACHFKQDKRSYAFHQPNVVKDRSCSVCHQEHRGPGPLKIVASSQCATCHNDRLTMAASAQKGRQLDWKNFRRHPHPPQQIVFDLDRPVDGYTQTFPSFWDGHPEFQLKRDPRARDLDVLKFNHERHFAPDIPMVGGKKLECNFCHQPDSEGRYNNQRITFAAQCQICHSLQFDPKNPELTLPHGNTTAVRGFLLSLPAHYAELAAKKGINRPNEIKNFVTWQMLQLRARVHGGEDFEHQIFFTKDPYKPQAQSEPRVRALFYGCKLCHEVEPRAPAEAPFIAKPVFVDRWMLRVNFDHTQHRSVKCDDCHHATQSRLTTDVLMPGIASCVTCHSPKGKVAAECITCHSYHAPASLTVAEVRPGDESPDKKTATAQRP